MKLRKSNKLLLSFLLILISVSACGFNKEEAKTEPPVSENRCGDSVCDGPENIKNCAEDCSVVVIDQSSGTEKNEEDDSANDASSQEKTGLGNTKKFRVMMTIVFESDISKIPGYDGSPYSEPVGYGLIDLEVAFPASGGFNLYNSGTIKLTNYEEKGPYCSFETPEGMIGATSDISWNQIYWEPDGRLSFEADVAYENQSFTITVTCPPVSGPIEEYPIYKLIGVFNEEMQSFSIDLNDSSHYFENIHWGMHDTMQTSIDVVVDEIQ